MKRVWIVGAAFLCGAAVAASPGQEPGNGVQVNFQALDMFIAQACHQDQVNGDPARAAIFATCARTQAAVFNLHLGIQIALAKLSSAEAQEAVKKCSVTDAGGDPTRLEAALACLETGVVVTQAGTPPASNAEEKELLPAGHMGMMMATVPGVGAGAGAPIQPAPDKNNVGANETKPVKSETNSTYVMGQHVGSSAYRTTSTCKRSTAEADDTGMVTKNPDVIGVRRSIMGPQEASDDYGRRLGKRFIVYQVRVSNFSKDFQYVVHDISLNLDGILPTTYGRFDRHGKELPLEAFQASTRELAMLRGVSEKGEDLDPRNLTLHTLEGIGSVGGAVSGLTPFTDVMGPAMGVFSGAFLQAFVRVAPDHTSTQLNRLSDEAFASNTLIDKLHTKVFAVFVPETVLLSSADQKEYWKHPSDLLNRINLDQVDVCVDGSLVMEAAVTPDPVFSPDEDSVAPGSKVTITDASAAAVLYYTTDGATTPTTSSTRYTGPITLSSAVGTKETIQVLAVEPNQASSPIVARTYAIQAQAPKPTISPATAAKGSKTISVTLALGTGQTTGQLYYTLNGTGDPTPRTATLYTGAFNVPAGTKVKAIATGPDNSTSPVAEVDY